MCLFLFCFYHCLGGVFFGCVFFPKSNKEQIGMWTDRHKWRKRRLRLVNRLDMLLIFQRERHEIDFSITLYYHLKIYISYAYAFFGLCSNSILLSVYIPGLIRYIACRARLQVLKELFPLDRVCLSTKPQKCQTMGEGQLSSEVLLFILLLQFLW